MKNITDYIIEIISSKESIEKGVYSFIKDRIEKDLSNLTEREREVLKMRNGLFYYNKPYTLEEVAQVLGVTRERIRQIEAKAIRRINHYQRRQRFNQPNEISKEVITDNTPVEELDLSFRPYICLKRANIHTVGELTLKTERELMRLRNLGSKSLKEIIQKLEERGLYLKGSQKQKEKINNGKNE
jgi:DNA-binding CsgD family transcriptional regulator